MRVAELMTKPAWTVRPDTPLKVAASIMAAQRVSGLPVVDSNGRPVGVVSEADVLAKERPRGLRPDRKGDAVSVGEAMTTPPITVRGEASIEVAAALMAEHDVRRLPVVDEADRVVGVASRSDLVRISAP
jgi:CBS domain-containing protein